jgi:serine/threonine protein kinase
VYTEAVDLWAFGVVLFLMATRQHPFHWNDNENRITVKRVCTEDYDRARSPESFGGQFNGKRCSPAPVHHLTSHQARVKRVLNPEMNLPDFDQSGST